MTVTILSGLGEWEKDPWAYNVRNTLIALGLGGKIAKDNGLTVQEPAPARRAVEIIPSRFVTHEGLAVITGDRDFTPKPTPSSYDFEEGFASSFTLTVTNTGPKAGLIVFTFSYLQTVTAVTVNGSPAKLLFQAIDPGSGAFLSAWQKTSLSETGDNIVVATLSGNANATVAALAWENVDQEYPFSQVARSTGTGNSLTYQTNYGSPILIVLLAEIGTLTLSENHTLLFNGADTIAVSWAEGTTEEITYSWTNSLSSQESTFAFRVNANRSIQQVTNVPLAPDDSDTDGRIDTVVVDSDIESNTVTIHAVEGTPAATPVAPTLTQVEEDQWQEPLAYVSVPLGAQFVSDDEITSAPFGEM